MRTIIYLFTGLFLCAQTSMIRAEEHGHKDHHAAPAASHDPAHAPEPAPHQPAIIHPKKPTVIKAKAPPVESPSDIKTIARDIAKLEESVAELSTDVQMQRQHLLEKAKTNNKLDVILKFNDTAMNYLSGVDARLDDFPIYTLDPARGLWIPRPEHMIYTGPVAIGKHTIRLDTRFLTVGAAQNSLADPAINRIDEEFTIDLPVGEFHKRFVILVEAAESGRAKIKTNLEDAVTVTPKNEH